MNQKSAQADDEASEGTMSLHLYYVTGIYDSHIEVKISILYFFNLNFNLIHSQVWSYSWETFFSDVGGYMVSENPRMRDIHTR